MDFHICRLDVHTLFQVNIYSGMKQLAQDYVLIPRRASDRIPFIRDDRDLTAHLVALDQLVADVL